MIKLPLKKNLLLFALLGLAIRLLYSHLEELENTFAYISFMILSLIFLFLGLTLFVLTIIKAAKKEFKPLITFTLIITFFYFTLKSLLPENNIENYEELGFLYYECDTVVRINDTLKIINSKRDTIIVETGIFTFLQYDYPLTTPHKLINLAKTAIQFDNQFQIEEAKNIYEDMIDFYINERPENLKKFSCMNGYFQYEVNSGILCSYAYEKLGDLDNSIKVLQPLLANSEAWHSKIHERYIQLCIEKFGIEKVRVELENCGKTVQFKRQNGIKDDWVVNVFGAEIGIGQAWHYEHISPSEADSLVRQMLFYKLIQ